VRYYNDSKSTTAESVASAVSAFENNVFLIAGGRDKGCNFLSIKRTIAQCVKGIYLIGEAAGRMKKEWAGCAPITVADSLQQALYSVHSQSLRGDVVVFSPGCSSFDMFKNFEQRGEVFKELVRHMNEKRQGSHA
jgi:UDP-N-acetylmuramoylalanine--D-glutamate ligase